MYMQELPEPIFTTTKVKIKYDCCEVEREMKWVDANKNFTKNNGKHICKICGRTGQNNPACRPEVKAKMKATIDERYGGILPMNSKEAIEAKRQQFQDPEFVEQRNQKRIATSIEKYGAEHHMKTEEGKNAQKEAMIAKYGVEHPLQSPEIVAKMLQTVQERHGVNNVMQIQEVMERQQQTTLERHGVTHYNQLPEMKDYLRNHCKEWLADSYANPWAKGITRPEEWNKKQSETMTEKIINGKFSPEDPRFYYTGYYKSAKCKKPRAFYRSSLELIMHYVLDSDSNIMWYENEPFSIKYEKSPGIIRNYIPDFFAFCKTGSPKLFEIKPAFRLREDSVRYKVEAALRFCETNNFEFVYIDEKYLNNLSLDLDYILKLPQVESLK